MNAITYAKTLPARPYCTATIGRRPFIRDAAKAVGFPMIQHNSPLVWRWMVFDIDSPDAYDRAEDRGCPLPTFTAINRANGHAHVGYLLETPVTAFTTSSRKAVDFYMDVERGFTHRLGADRAYSGFLSKNPVSDAWAVDWQAQTPYDLARLNDCLDRSDKRKLPRAELAGAGRNYGLFQAVSKIAYAQWWTFHKAGRSFEEFGAMLQSAADGINKAFPVPLTQPEVKGITRSVAKWVWKKFSPEQLSAIQSARGKNRWKNITTLTELKPWEAEGISRASWYRKRETIAISG